MTTRRDFNAHAELIRSELERFDPLFDTDARDAISRIARGLADLHAASNGRFDRQRFYFACGLDEQGKSTPQCSVCKQYSNTAFRDEDGIMRCEECYRLDT
jgi:hypothetical protein